MDWFEIFKVGKHTDSSGNTREWSLKDLEEIVSSYKPEENRAPIVIGHPEIDSPAYGWIEALKVDGEKLLAKPGQLIDQFKEWVRQGLYKKVSIALYPDLTLRHVGFLGGTPPAIKGLKEAAFGDKKAAWVIESIWAYSNTPLQFEDKTCSHMNPDDTFIGGFEGCVEHMMSCEGHDEDSARKICAYIGRKTGKIHSEPVAADLSLRDSKNKGGTTMREWITKFEEAIGLAKKELTPDPSVKFTEADIQAKVKEAEDKTFAEAQKKIDAEKKEKEEAQKKLKEIETQKKKEDIATFCEAMCKEGKLTPALRKTIEPAMIAVAGDETVIEFAEASGTIKKTKLDCLKDFVKALPKLITFSEVAGDDKTKIIPKDFDTAVQAVMTEKKISRGKAIEFCAKEYPELHDEYVTNLKGK